MIVTRLELSDKSKVRVYIDGTFVFFLYLKEVEAYQLSEDREITDLLYDIIIKETVLPRAKKKAVDILKFMDRPEVELTRKLQDGYHLDIIQKVIDYLKEYDYLNDERYIANYIKYRKNTKSRLMIRNELLKKGIKKELLDNILKDEYEAFQEENSEEYKDPEEIAIKKAIAKKVSDPGILTYEEKQKLIAALYRKGFHIDTINKFLS